MNKVKKENPAILSKFVRRRLQSRQDQWRIYLFKNEQYRLIIRELFKVSGFYNYHTSVAHLLSLSPPPSLSLSLSLSLIIRVFTVFVLFGQKHLIKREQISLLMMRGNRLKSHNDVRQFFNATFRNENISISKSRFIKQTFWRNW